MTNDTGDTGPNDIRVHYIYICKESYTPTTSKKVEVCVRAKTMDEVKELFKFAKEEGKA